VVATTPTIVMIRAVNEWIGVYAIGMTENGATIDATE
jgi:hypothetical protein